MEPYELTDEEITAVIMSVATDDLVDIAIAQAQRKKLVKYLGEMFDVPKHKPYHIMWQTRRRACNECFIALLKAHEVRQ